MLTPSAPIVTKRPAKTAAVRKVTGWLGVASLVLSLAAAVANAFKPSVVGPIQQAGQVVDALGSALSSDDAGQ